MPPLTKLMQRLLPWVLAALICITIGSLPAVAQEASAPRTLVVSGHGRAQTPTSLAQISLGLSNKGDSAKDTYTALNKRSSAVVKLLKSGKAKVVKTSNINLTVKSDRDGKPQKDGYDGYQNIEFQVPAADIGVLDDAIATDIDRLNNIQYVAPEASISAARNTALENAIADAQAQAKVALDKLGFTTQEIVDINVGDPHIQSPKTNPNPDSYSSWSENIPAIEGGEQTVDVTATLKIRY